MTTAPDHKTEILKSLDRIEDHVQAARRYLGILVFAFVVLPLIGLVLFYLDRA